MNLVFSAGHLERAEKSKDTDKDGTFGHQRFQLYHKLSRHLDHLTCHDVIVMLGATGQARTVVV